MKVLCCGRTEDYVQFTCSSTSTVADSVSSAEEALRACAEQSYDVILFCGASRIAELQKYRSELEGRETDLVRSESTLSSLHNLLDDLDQSVIGAKVGGPLPKDVARQLSRAAASCLLQPKLDVFAFLACGEVLHAVLAGERDWVAKIAIAAQWLQSCVGPARWTSLVRAFVAPLSVPCPQDLRRLERDVIQKCGTSLGDLRFTVRRHTGVTTRDLLWAANLGGPTMALLHSHDHVRQIAYRYGYGHHSQFDREFRRMFGVSPRVFRRALSTAEE
jgi:AraC-like DNA-binding protein